MGSRTVTHMLLSPGTHEVSTLITLIGKIFAEKKT